MSEDPTPAQPPRRRTLAEMRQDPRWLAHLASKPVLSRFDCVVMLLAAIWATASRSEGPATTGDALGGRVTEAAFVWGAAALVVVVCFWGAARTSITPSQRNHAVLTLAIGTLLLAAYNAASWTVSGWHSDGASALIPQTLEVILLAALAWTLRRHEAIEEPGPNG